MKVVSDQKLVLIVVVSMDTYKSKFKRLGGGGEATLGNKNGVSRDPFQQLA